MKKHIHIFIILISLIPVLPAFAQRSGMGRSGGGSGTCATLVAEHFDALETVELTEAEIEEMVFLREEEKLARDVYLSLAETWQLPIFSQIAGAESQHMSRVLVILDLYGIADPIIDDSVGAFSNPDLGALYGTLVEQGQSSLADALGVGAMIEDLDLADLEEILALSDNDPLEFVCENLAKGSRNHLRAFMRALQAQGGDYLPQYLDSDTFESILASDMERGIVYDESGEVLAECGGRFGGQGNGGSSTGNGNNGGSTGNGNNSGGGNGGGDGSGDCDGTGPSRT